MGEIYGRSQRCLIWIDTDRSIGVEPEMDLAWSQGAGNEVRELLQSFDRDEIHQILQSPTVEESDPLPALESLSSRPNAMAREHLLWFFEHPWFTRVWVFQDFVLSNETVFLIGDFEHRGKELEQFFSLGWPRSAAWLERFHHSLQINRSRATLFDRAPGMEFLRAAFQSRHQLVASINDIVPLNVPVSLRDQKTFTGYISLTFSDMLEAMAASQSRDERDHVYALIGFAPFILRHMTVDYSLSVEEIFAAMMKSLIKEGRNTDFFYMLPSEAEISQSTLRLSSWVPNWAVKSDRVSTLCHDNLFYATGKSFGLPATEQCQHHLIKPSA